MLDTRIHTRDTPDRMNNFIYFVGKPYPLPEALVACRKMGYSIGIFQDINIPLKNPGNFDKIIPVNFASTETILASIQAQHITVSGLVCTYENYIVAKSIIAKHFNVPAQSIESARMCTDKYLMRQAFMDKDRSITPNFGLVSSHEELLDLAATLSYPLILKPTNLVKSMLVLKCSDEKELIDNYTYAKERIIELYKEYKIYDRVPQLIVEEYVTGKTCSIAAFIDAEGIPHYCEGIVDLVNAQDLHIDDNFIYARNLPAHFSPELTNKLYTAATKGIEALDMRSTPAHVELIYNDSEVKLIEIGSRIGGYRPRMYNIGYGMDLITQEINLARGHTPYTAGTFKSYCSVFELFPEREGHFVSIEGMDISSEVSYYSVKAKPGSRVGPAKNGHKACAVIIVASDDKNTYESLCSKVDALKVTKES